MKEGKAKKDNTRNQRTQQREEKIKLACQKFGFKNKSELLTALINNQVEIVRIRVEVSSSK